MSTIDPREEALFDAALELAPPARVAFLHSECGGDLALRSGVAQLLSIHDSELGVLDLPPLGLATAESAFEPGDSIGPYQLIEEIGSGGMGVVFLAEQSAPVRREVALKLIKPGMDTRSVIARFEGERQALALLDHPAITKVFDAGATPTGRPYFVMELCRGTSITEYCRTRELSLEDRLILFARVCDAIEHAHQKGILHRDLKPSNVLVIEEDGAAAPKVIDFGVAKALTTSLGGETLVTHVGQIIGTPEYTSPEQCENGLDVDTRSDVYSLGVLLYELLTGVTPVGALGVTGSGVLDAVRTLDPPPPSQRLRRESEIGALAASTARRCRGEIDWIVGRALEKNRTDRYQSAREFARDVRGHLSGGAVNAAAPTVGYRVRKLFARHRAAVLTGALIGVVLLAAAVISTTLALRLDDSLAKAKVERDRAVEAEAKLAKMERDQRNQAAIYRALARYAEETFLGGPLGGEFQDGALSISSIDETAAAILEDLRGTVAGTDRREADGSPITIEKITGMIRDAHGLSFDVEQTIDILAAGAPREGRSGPVQVGSTQVRVFFEGIDLAADFDPHALLRNLPEHAMTLILEEQRRAFGESDPIVEATLDRIGRPGDEVELESDAHPCDALIEGFED